MCSTDAAHFVAPSLHPQPSLCAEGRDDEGLKRVTISHLHRLLGPIIVESHLFLSRCRAEDPARPQVSRFITNHRENQRENKKIKERKNNPKVAALCATSA